MKELAEEGHDGKGQEREVEGGAREEAEEE